MLYSMAAIIPPLNGSSHTICDVTSLYCNYYYLYTARGKEICANITV